MWILCHDTYSMKSKHKATIWQQIIYQATFLFYFFAKHCDKVVILAVFYWSKSNPINPNAANFNTKYREFSHGLKYVVYKTMWDSASFTVSVFETLILHCSYQMRSQMLLKCCLTFNQTFNMEHYFNVFLYLNIFSRRGTNKLRSVCSFNLLIFIFLVGLPLLPVSMPCFIQTHVERKESSTKFQVEWESIHWRLVNILKAAKE